MVTKKMVYSSLVLSLLIFGGAFIWFKYFTVKEIFLKEMNGYSIYMLSSGLQKNRPSMCATELIRKTETKEEIGRFRLCENNIVSISETSTIVTVTANCGSWEKNVRTGEEKINTKCSVGGFSKE